jgi:dTDP-4-amino-4,6-dideoxygalactose transaminase
MSFELITTFEKRLSNFFGSKHAICVDSCTHGLELVLRYRNEKKIIVPKRTYLSVPFLANKLNIEREWKDENWEDFYALNDGDRKIIDAAVLWEENSYIPNTFMCISFQYQKHLSLGRGGVILLDNDDDALILKKMSYDGRLPNLPWREQNIDCVGYHYYMTPETAKLGLDKIDDAIKNKPKKWKVSDWPDLTEMKIFKNE